MHKSDKIHAHTIMMHSVQALYCNWDCHWDCLRILGLEQIQLPISFDEAMVLVQIFPENAFYDLQWSLLRLVESVSVDDDRYIQLINSCPSQEWRDTLNARYANNKNAQEVK